MLESPGLPLAVPETQHRPWWAGAGRTGAGKGTLPRATAAAPLTHGNLERAGAQESLARILLSACLASKLW